MKYVIIIFILGYQRFISPLLKQLLGVSSQCKFSPTCSQYAISSIAEHGVFKGLTLSLKRTAKCQSFFSFI